METYINNTVDSRHHSRGEREGTGSEKVPDLRLPAASDTFREVLRKKDDVFRSLTSLKRLWDSRFSDTDPMGESGKSCLAGFPRTLLFSLIKSFDFGAWFHYITPFKIVFLDV